MKKTVVILSHVVFDDSEYCKFVHSHAKALAKEGYDVQVFAMIPWFPFISILKKKRKRIYKEYKGVIQKDNVTIIYKKYLSFSNFLYNTTINLNGLSYYASLKKIFSKLFNKKNKQICFIDAHMFKTEGYAAYLLKKKYNIKTFVTLHGTSFQRCFATQIGRNLIQKISKVVDSYICVSEKIYNNLEKLDIQNKKIIYNGIEFYPVQRANNNHNIVFVGALNQIKNPYILLLAFEKIHKKYPKSNLIIIGQGPLENQLKNFVNEKNLNNVVKFTGHIPAKKVYEHLSNSKVFVLPSSPEGFGISYIEAMYCGCIAVGIKGEGIDGFIKNGENGYLIFNDEESIYKCLDYIFQNNTDLIRDVGIKDAQSLTWKENARKYIELSK